jgi:hypothetical protein
MSRVSAVSAIERASVAAILATTSVSESSGEMSDAGTDDSEVAIRSRRFCSVRSCRRSRYFS